MSIQLAKRLLTVTDYHKMAEVGILDEDDRVELINGEIIEMSPIGSIHTSRLKRIMRLFHNMPNVDKYLVSVQDPIFLGKYSEPQPDLAILHFRADFYEEKHPEPQDILLVIEVSDTSLGYDREVKKPLFAAAGIPELWIVNIEDEQVEVYKTPQNGDYSNRQDFKRGEAIFVENLGFEVEVDKVLG
ncbi:MAG: Uma2 family endonuclease [Saprospiraceae bacterium]|nr:Uma2 family endonuclease [Saprospiraceae bacterium]